MCPVIFVLRITYTAGDRAALKLEGRLVGPWVDELRNTVLRIEAPGMPAEVDLRELTFADEDGERALLWLFHMGAQFRGGGSFSDYLCQRLGIPLRYKERPRGK